MAIEWVDDGGILARSGIEHGDVAISAHIMADRNGGLATVVSGRIGGLVIEDLHSVPADMDSARANCEAHAIVMVGTLEEYISSLSCDVSMVAHQLHDSD